MTLQFQNILMDQLIKEHDWATVKDFIEAKAEIEQVEIAVIKRPDISKKIKNYLRNNSTVLIPKRKKANVNGAG